MGFPLTPKSTTASLALGDENAMGTAYFKLCLSRLMAWSQVIWSTNQPTFNSRSERIMSPHIHNRVIIYDQAISPDIEKLQLWVIFWICYTYHFQYLLSFVLSFLTIGLLHLKYNSPCGRFTIHSICDPLQ